MGVAGKRQRHAVRHVRENVRLVHEQHDRIVGFDLAPASRQIVDAAEAAMPEPMGELIADARRARTAARRRRAAPRRFPAPGCARRRARARTPIEVVPPVMIAKDRPDAERRLEPRKFRRPSVRRARARSRSGTARCNRRAARRGRNCSALAVSITCGRAAAACSARRHAGRRSR